MFDFRSGARNGTAAALMKPVVAKLSEEDMLSISAYLTSLEP
jgi:cytochrome c553